MLLCAAQWIPSRVHLEAACLTLNWMAIGVEEVGVFKALVYFSQAKPSIYLFFFYPYLIQIDVFSGKNDFSLINSIQGLVHCKLTYYISPIYETPGFGLTFSNSHGPFSRFTGVRNSTQLTSTVVEATKHLPQHGIPVCQCHSDKYCEHTVSSKSMTSSSSVKANLLQLAGCWRRTLFLCCCCLFYVGSRGHNLLLLHGFSLCETQECLCEFENVNMA